MQYVCVVLMEKIMCLAAFRLYHLFLWEDCFQFPIAALVNATTIDTGPGMGEIKASFVNNMHT